VRRRRLFGAGWSVRSCGRYSLIILWDQPLKWPEKSTHVDDVNSSVLSDCGHKLVNLLLVRNLYILRIFCSSNRVEGRIGCPLKQDRNEVMCERLAFSMRYIVRLRALQKNNEQQYWVGSGGMGRPNLDELQSGILQRYQQN
jgi:hypothetical protein